MSVIPIDWHMAQTGALCALIMSPVILPIPILMWVFSGGLCHVIGHRPHLVVERDGRYVQTGTRSRRVGGPIWREVVDIPIHQFVPSGLPDRHVSKCRFCGTEFD